MIVTYFLGLDVSTTGAKALLLDAAGQVHTGCAEEYPLSTPYPLWAEQDPEDWWRAGSLAIQRLLADTGVPASEVTAVGLTGHMFGLTPLNAAGQPIRPCLMWNDQRAGAQCDEITRELGLPRLIELTANCMLPGYVAPKLLWLRQYEPAAYRQIAHLLVAKDYVRYRLTGDLATDVTDAPGTGLFDVAQRAWSAEMLERLEIPASWLPSSYEAPAVTGRVSQAGAAATGLAAGTPVVAGAGDQPAQAVGSGIVEPGRASVTLGTSGVVFVATPGPVAHPQGQLHAFCHAMPGTWCLMGVVMSAGGSLRWFRDVLGEAEKAAAAAGCVDPYELLTAEALAVPAGSEGLLFLPYLTGERTPYVDPRAGGWLGLTARHGRGHLVRAIMEGVGFAMRDALEMVEKLYPARGPVLVSGGGARSALWRQILADISQSRADHREGNRGRCPGCGHPRGVGAGYFASVPDACSALIHVESTTAPDPRHAARYAGYYEVYRSMYGTLQAANHRLSDLAASQ